MKCVIPGANVKILAKGIHALAKIGDEMYIEPQENVLSFRSVNTANSAYADFTFFHGYFSYYDYGDLQENDALKCKISMRSAMTVFKAVNLIDKQVETCHIRLESEASEVLFILKYKNSITKTHLLPILDCERLQTAFDKDSASVKLSSQPRVLGDAVQNFHQHLVEITLEVTAQKLLLRNYVDDASGLSNTTRTQLALGKGEFDRYEMGSETSITFCMKEFKSILSFADVIGTPFGIYLEGAGRPVIFALKNQCFEVNLVMSTLSSDADSQTDTTLASSKPERSMKRVTASRKGSRKTANRSTTTSAARKNKSALESSKNNATLRTTRSSFTEEPKEDDSIVRETETKRNDGNCQQQQQQHSERETRDESGKHFSPSVRSDGNGSKKLVDCVFSSISKRKSSGDDGRKSVTRDKCDALEDEVPSSPPPPTKKARLIFQKCFQRTFDPRTLPGYDVILAEDSDESGSD